MNGAEALGSFAGAAERPSRRPVTPGLEGGAARPTLGGGTSPEDARRELLEALPPSRAPFLLRQPGSATEEDRVLTEKLMRELDQERQRVAGLQGQLERITLLTDGEASSTVLSSRGNRLTMCLGDGAVQV